MLQLPAAALKSFTTQGAYVNIMIVGIVFLYDNDIYIGWLVQFVWSSVILFKGLAALASIEYRPCEVGAVVSI